MVLHRPVELAALSGIWSKSWCPPAFTLQSGPIANGQKRPFASARLTRLRCRSRLHQVEEEHLGVLHSCQLDGLLGGDGRAIALLKFRPIQLHAAPRHLHVGMPVRLQFMSHGLSRTEYRRIQFVVLTNRDRAVAPIRGRYQVQFPALFTLSK